MLEDRGHVEMAIPGRGGQGVKTAGDLLVHALFAAGYRVNGQPLHGGERMGAPVMYFLRFNRSGLPIHDRTIGFGQLREEHRAVFLGVGLSRPRRLDIPGASRDDVVSGLTLLRQVSEGRSVGLGRRVLVIGEVPERETNVRPRRED